MSSVTGVYGRPAAANLADVQVVSLELYVTSPYRILEYKTKEESALVNGGLTKWRPDRRVSDDKEIVENRK